MPIWDSWTPLRRATGRSGASSTPSCSGCANSSAWRSAMPDDYTATISSTADRPKIVGIACVQRQTRGEGGLGGEQIDRPPSAGLAADESAGRTLINHEAWNRGDR